MAAVLILAGLVILVTNPDPWPWWHLGYIAASMLWIGYDATGDDR